MTLRERWQEARARGDKVFDIGIPCQRGHRDGRRAYKRGAPCIGCHNAVMGKYYANQRAALLEKQRNYYLEHRDKCLTNQKEYYWRNADKVKEYSRAYYWRNRERILAYQKQKYLMRVKQNMSDTEND